MGCRQDNNLPKKEGNLSATNGKVDSAEMVRCFGEPSLEKGPESLQLEVLQNRAATLQQQVAELERIVAATHREKEALLQERVQIVQEKEWLRGQVDKAQELSLIHISEPTRPY